MGHFAASVVHKGNGMNVFILWSGDRSKEVAEVLASSLRLCLQATRPWLSTGELLPGQGWFEKLRKNLEDTHFCILCFTPENKEALRS